MRFLLFIFIVSRVYAITDFNAENIVKDIISTEKASKNYLKDVGYWPSSIVELLSTNYLPNEIIKEIILINKDGKLTIAVAVDEKHSLLLQKYLNKSNFDKKNNLLLIPISKIKFNKKSNNKQLFFGICSNLYCNSI